MENNYIIAGTDTDIGKTVFAASLVGALGGQYWKPIQSGIETHDTDIVKLLSGLPDTHFYDEAYVLSAPLSPHRAAELDKVDIDIANIVPPQTNQSLIIELAGGLMVPITRDVLQIDMIKQWTIPVILCARTELGTINHTLLSIEALKIRGLNLHGIAFIGDENKDNIKTIGDFTGVKILGCLPLLDDLNARTLSNAFKQNFNQKDF